jgi:cell wall-associated NlpC family hydrolase
LDALLRRCGRPLARALVCALFSIAPPQPTGAQGVAGSAADVVIGAIGLIGVPYRPGGDDPATGLDCSGLVRRVFLEVRGMHLPRQAEAMSRAGTAVGRDLLSPGDLVFFNTLGRPNSHVGIYVGEGQFVHAPARRGRVRIERMSVAYWRTRFDSARRLLPTTDLAPSSAAEPLPAPGSDQEDPLGLRRP